MSSATLCFAVLFTAAVAWLAAGPRVAMQQVLVVLVGSKTPVHPWQQLCSQQWRGSSSSETLLLWLEHQGPACPRC